MSLNKNMTSSSPSNGEKHKIPFGVREGKIVHVQDVSHGKKCGCFCAECERPLVASNREPRKVAKYFRHGVGADCPGGYETAIHRAAKEVLLRRREVTVPGGSRRLSVIASDGHEFSEVVALSSKIICPSSAFEEYWQEGIRPDVVYENDGRLLYIEIRVTHAVDEQKKLKIRDRGCNAIEIDLGNLTPSDVFDMKSFEERVCHELACRSWVFWPEFEEMIEDSIRRLKQMRDAYEERLRQLEERRRIAEQAKQERLRKEAEEKAKALAEKAAADVARRNRARRRYEKVLSRLHEAQDEGRIAAWDQYLQKFSLYQSPQGHALNGAGFLLAKVEGFWIFNARYQDWQAYIIDLLFPSEPIGRPISLVGLKRAVLEKFEVVPWVKEINDLEYARKRYPDSDAGMVLSTTEVGLVPDPYTAISNYIKHLSALRLVGPRLEWVEGDRGISLSAVLDRYKKWQEERETRMALERFASRMRSDEEREKMAQMRELSVERARKLETAVRASEIIVFQEHNGKGVRCGRCYMVSSKGAVECVFCNQKSLMKLVIIDEEYLRTSKFRMRSSAEFNKVVSSLPELSLEMLQPKIAEVIRGDIEDPDAAE